MSVSSYRIVFSLAFLVSLRMFGLFIAMPVLSVYGMQLEGATSTLVGLSIGIYGLAQVLAQIPMGFLADKIGRKPVIYIGLLLFALGSFVAASSQSVYGVLLGRLLQGFGAISGAVLAFVADVTLESERTKAMAIVGMSIGLSFMLALLVGPSFSATFGLSGVFGLTGALALFGLAVAYYVVPKEQSVNVKTEGAMGDAWKHILSARILSFNISVLFLHMTMSAIFFALPQVLLHQLSIPLEKHGMIYLVFMLVSFLLIVPLVFYAERKKRISFALVGSVALIACGFISLYWSGSVFADASSWWGVMSGAFLYFAGFNALESLLPSMMSKEAPAHLKGTVMGVFSTCQFLGAFLGGTFAGVIASQYQMQGVWSALVVSALLWLIVIFMLSVKSHHPENK